MEEESITNYYVDEAGDLTFFNKKKKIIIGQQGVSKFFMVGVALINNSDLLKQQLETLRSNVLNDPQYKNIPSMQPEKKKTAIAFHAKDDFSEIRPKVFDILKNSNTKVFVVIQSKKELALSTQKKFLKTGKKALNQNKIYDNLVTRLFKDRLLKAKKNFEKTWSKNTLSEIYVKSAYPSEYMGLQVVDYYLWALQRLYERQEDKFFKSVAHQYKLIIDIDDRRKKPYGEYYCKTNPLLLEKIDFKRG